MAAEKCEHCGRDIKPHTQEWRTHRPDDPHRPVEDGEEWGDARLWIFNKMSGVMCAACYNNGKKFKNANKYKE